MVHRCLICIDDAIKKDTMLTRKKSAAALSSSQIRRSNAESPKISKDKKLKLPQKDEIKPAKKSRRVMKKVPVDMPSPQIQRNEKRKTETADPNKSKKLKTLKKGQKDQVKTYCWVCHKSAQGQTCTCQRVYHNECLEKTSKVFANNKCPECQLISVNGTELTRPFIDGIKVYLESATKWITGKHKNEMSWPQNSDIVPALDVETLNKKVQSNSYKTTAEFYADVKWFYHDRCILYGEHSKHCKDIKKIIKEFKEELFDMEACPECYYHLYIHKEEDSDDEDCEKAENSINEKFFVRLCNPPHDIVWAKVSGYSHFPAKCLKVINGKARLRFFGKHEKSDIPINTIFHISRAHPMHKNKNILDVETRTSLEYTYARRELLEYITLYEGNVGNFQLFGFRVFYDPDKVETNTGEKTVVEPRLSELTTASPALTSTPTDFETQQTNIPCPSTNTLIDMTFSADTHTPEISTSALVPASCIQEKENAAGQSPSLPLPDSNTSSAESAESFSTESAESFSAIPACSMATLNGIQIKEEFRPTKRISLFAESPSDDFMQIFGNALFSSSFCSNGGSTSSLDSCLARIFQSVNSRRNSEMTISPSASVPNSAIIKEEFDDCLPSTSEILQPERQIDTSDVHRPERQITISEVHRPERQITISDIHQPERQITTSEVHRPERRITTSEVDQPERQIATSDVDRPERQITISEVHRPERQITTSEVHLPERQITISDVHLPERQITISDVHQPERQITTDSTENATTTRDQQPSDPEVGTSSSNNEIAVIDLTGDDDSTPQPEPSMQMVLKRTQEAVGSFFTRICAEVCKMQTPEPSQMCMDLTKKLDETEKKFQEETEKLRDQIKHLEKNLVAEK